MPEGGEISDDSPLEVSDPSPFEVSDHSPHGVSDTSIVECSVALCHVSFAAHGVSVFAVYTFHYT